MPDLEMADTTLVLDAKLLEQSIDERGNGVADNHDRGQCEQNGNDWHNPPSLVLTGKPKQVLEQQQ
jgi:hypothetical protein